MFDVAWQEIIFFIGGFVFFAALLPSILSAHKPDFRTCVVTASILTLFVFAFGTLNMWLSVLGQTTVAIGWWILTIQTFQKQVAVQKEQREETTTQ